MQNILVILLCAAKIYINTNNSKLNKYLWHDNFLNAWHIYTEHNIFQVNTAQLGYGCYQYKNFINGP